MDMPTGTQSLSRSIRLLRVLATRGEIGWRLSDLAAACELDKSTAHRILAALQKERLVQQRAGDRRYLPGPLLFELGLSVHGQHAFQDVARARLAPWSRRMDGSALLLLRSGHEYVCSVRAGPARLPGLMVEQGTRRPLFTSVGGVAILQTFGEDEAREVLANNVEQEVAKRGTARLPLLEKMRERSARHGFGVNLGDVVSGVHAFAVPLRGPEGTAFASVCLIGTAERFPPSRLQEVHEELTRLAGELQQEAQQLLFAPAGPNQKSNM